MKKNVHLEIAQRYRVFKTLSNYCGHQASNWFLKSREFFGKYNCVRWYAKRLNRQWIECCWMSKVKVALSPRAPFVISPPDFIRFGNWSISLGFMIEM